MYSVNLPLALFARSHGSGDFDIHVALGKLGQNGILAGARRTGKDDQKTVVVIIHRFLPPQYQAHRRHC